MVSIMGMRLPTETPIVGVQLTPHVLLRRPDGNVTPNDAPESDPLDGHFLRYLWYRGHRVEQVWMCSKHHSRPATHQCIVCANAKLPVAQSYHCSVHCYKDAWPRHRALHERAANAAKGTGSGVIKTSLTGSASSTSLTDASIPLAEVRRGGETWFEVGRSKTYTPTPHDINHVLKFECIVVHAETKRIVEQRTTISSSPVIPASAPIPRSLIQH